MYRTTGDTGKTKTGGGSLLTEATATKGTARNAKDATDDLGIIEKLYNAIDTKKRE